MKKIRVAATAVMVCVTVVYICLVCVNLCHIPIWRLLFSIVCHIGGLVLLLVLGRDIVQNDSRRFYGFRTDLFQLAIACILLSFVLLRDKIG